MGSEDKNDDSIYGQPIEVLGHLPGWLMVAVLSVMTASVTEVRKYLIIVTGRGDDLKILGAKSESEKRESGTAGRTGTAVFRFG